jgi:hypothetical protein
MYRQVSLPVSIEVEPSDGNTACYRFFEDAG